MVIEDKKQYLHNWNISVLKVSKVYNAGSFKLKQNYVVKTIEKTCLTIHDTIEFHFLPKKFIEEYRKKFGYLI